MIIELEEAVRTGAIGHFWQGLGKGNTLASLVLRTVNFQRGTVEP